MTTWRGILDRFGIDSQARNCSCRLWRSLTECTGVEVRPSASCTRGNMSVETKLHIPGQPGRGCCTRWKERAPTRRGAATCALSDGVYAFISTASYWRRELVCTETEAAARTRLDADYAFLSTALSRRREIMWTRTEGVGSCCSD